MKNYIFLLLISSLVFSSCETEEPTATYTLSTSVSPTEGGKIIAAPQSTNYTEGVIVTLIAEPNEHWVFQKWDGDGSGSTNSLQITMNSNKSVVGIFVKRDYPLSLTIEGEGTVEEKIITNPSGREYPHGTTVELTPKPKEGWVFDSWSGDLTGSEIPKRITVDKEKKVTAKFKRRDYPLTLTIEGEGTVEEKIVTNPSGREYPFQTVVELTPKPKEGWAFDSWGGDLTGTETPQTITVDKAKKVIAKFKKTPKFFLHENGVTIKCEDCKVGDKGKVNGVEYEAVDKQLLRQRLEEGKDLSKVCTSLVTSTMDLFDGFPKFNQPIGNWDVSNVVNMKGMFRSSDEWDDDTNKFNQSLEYWNVEKVTDMSFMFFNSEFNQPIGNWNVSKVTNMNGMFSNTEFNQPIGNWNVSKVTDMRLMFEGSEFNQPIGDWNVSNVTSMKYMFFYSKFNQPIGNWNISKVTDMSGMFSGTEFNQAIGDWNVSNVTNMNFMFSNSKFNQSIATWDVSKVTNMSGMFSGTEFNQAIGDWNVSNVTNMNFMFSNSKFNQSIATWDVSKVTNMSEMFSNCEFNQNISNWCVTNITSQPLDFSSKLTSQNNPKWGTCPD
jgi:uncharacterized repeat protein (TIGR02543 family)